MMLTVIAVLSILLTFKDAPYVLIAGEGLTLLCVAVAVLVPAGVAHLFARRCLRLLDLSPADPSIGQHSLGNGLRVVHFLLAASHMFVLGGTLWLDLCELTPVVGRWPMVPGLLAGLPFLVSIVLVWLAIYPADRAIRQIAVEMYLLRARPMHPVWPLSRYLVYNFRHEVLFVLVPMALILLIRDLIDMNADRIRALSPHEFVPDLLLGTAAGLVAVVAPTILRYVWVTRPLPRSALRDRLEGLSRRLRVRCREILVWESGGMVVNAAVMGLFAPLRYVMISDAMLEQMEDTKIEAVFGHEAGHVRHHHILYFLMFAFITGCLILIVSVYTRGMTRPQYQFFSAAAAAVLLLKWFVVFGWISRRFERQADVFGVRTLALAGVPCNAACAYHQRPEAAADRSDVPLCSTAASIFGDTLNDVAHLNGIPAEAPSWRHGSISSRSRVLQRLALEPKTTCAFERSVSRVKLGILITAILAGVAAAWSIRVWTILPAWSGG